MTNRFNAFRINSDNGAVHGSIVELGLQDLSPGDVVIRTACAGVNYKDALATTDEGKIIRRFPRIGGIDMSGVVETSADSRFRPGDQVIAHSRGLGVEHDGAFSEYVRVPGDWVVPLPEGLTLVDAAALGVAGYTAALAIHFLEQNGVLPASGPILVTGATGGVASMAIDMLAAKGYAVTALSAKTSAAERLKALGAAEVLTNADLADSGKPLDKPRWAGAVDSVGGEQLGRVLRSIQPNGVVASFGNAGGNEFSGNVLPFILRGVRLVGVSIPATLALQTAVWARLSTDLKPRHLSESTTAISLDALPDFIRVMLAGGSQGRTIVKFDRQKP